MHFIYKLSGENSIAALFVPVNESPWEHLKMLFFPFALFCVYTQIKFKQDKFNIFFAGYVSILAGMWSTLSYFYTLNGALGGNNEWVNFSSFFIGLAVAFALNYFLIRYSVGKGMPNAVCAAIMIITAGIFFLFTFKPPLIPLFQDPQNLSFGI